MRGELYMVTRKGDRIRVEPERQHLRRKVERLQAENQTKSTFARASFFAALIFLVAFIAVTAKCLSMQNDFNRQISDMADENLQQVTYITEEYRDLSNKYRNLEKENLELKDLIQDYEEILPFVDGSWDYYDPNIPLSADIQAATYRIGSMYGVEPQILYGIMRKESGFTENIVSTDGHDYGICQVRDSNHQWLRNELGDLDFMDAEDSITAAAFMLADIRDNYNYTDWNKILVVYNMGPGNAKDYFAKGNSSSPYSRLVLQYAKEYGLVI